jgi:hypothetical protein
MVQRPGLVSRRVIFRLAGRARNPSALSFIERDLGILLEAGPSLAPERPDHNACESRDQDQKKNSIVHAHYLVAVPISAQAGYPAFV